LYVPTGHEEDRMWMTLHDHSAWRRHFVLTKSFTAHMLSGHGGYGTTEIYERVDVAAESVALQKGRTQPDASKPATR
jgi:hypothetical protein